jgi:type II secretory pathway component PulK
MSGRLGSARVRTSAPRRGFALLAVLWVVAGMSTLGLGLALIAREATAEAQNRGALARAHWAAEGCTEVAHAIAADIAADQVNGESRWRVLDAQLGASLLLQQAQCNVAVHAAGSTLNVNTADVDQLHRLFAALPLRDAQADSLTDAIIDWRDGDDLPQPNGAEREWYAAQKRMLPRNAPFADARELDLVRGVMEVPGLDTLFGVESGRIALNQAPLPVLATLPGFVSDVLAYVADARARNVPITDLLTLAAALPPSARDSLTRHYAEAAPLVTTSPDAWIISVRVTDAITPVGVTAEVRLERVGTKTVVVRTREW